MPLTRRDALKIGAGAALAASTPQLMAQTGAINLKTIPSSGEKIPPIGIGTNRYGVGQAEEERAPLRDTMARFVALGGKVMDTAAVYGTSEAVIGDLAAGLGIRDKLFLVTKTAMFGSSGGESGVRSAFERLQTEMIDGFLVHNFANVASELPVLRKFKDDGKIKYIGASTSQDNQHAQMEEFMRGNDVQLVQLNYSLGDREAADRLLPLAGDRGIAVMVNIPFGGRGGSSLFNVVEGRELPAWAVEFDASTWGQFFLKYIISHPNVTVAIPGTRQVAHVNENFGAALGRLPDAGQRRRMEQFFDGL